MHYSEMQLGVLSFCFFSLSFSLAACTATSLFLPMDILRRAARSRSTRWVVSGAVSGKGLAYLATRETAFRDFSPSDDNLFNSPLYSRVNPHGNTTLHDLCVRRVDVSRIRPELVEDARNGGSGLVEEFCRGMWSGLGSFTGWHISQNGSGS